MAPGAQWDMASHVASGQPEAPQSDKLIPVPPSSVREIMDCEIGLQLPK